MTYSPEKDYLITSDNNPRGKEIERKHYQILKPFSNYSLAKLKNYNDNFLVFPTELEGNASGDPLFSVYEESSPENKTKYKFITYNTMGVFTVKNQDVGEVKVEIRSRFDNIESQPFLTYLLSEAFGGNFVDWKINYGSGMWNFVLLLLFPHYLIRAFYQGLFKQYRWHEENEFGFAGTLNVSEQIKNNIPFQGKIAYKIRRSTFDNKTLHLVRQAIWYLENSYSQLFKTQTTPDFKKACQAIKKETPSWRKQKFLEVIKHNLKPISHPFFTEYEPLRKLSIQILQEHGASIYQEEKQNEVEGVVFDGAWLWESYLAKLLTKTSLGFHHHTYPNDGIKVFADDFSKKFYPDFVNRDRKVRVVLDAKYKKIVKNGSPNPDREDIHQILSYMFLIDANLGGIIYPFSLQDGIKTGKTVIRRKIENKQNKCLFFGFPIPHTEEPLNEKLFLKEMIKMEEEFEKTILGEFL